MFLGILGNGGLRGQRNAGITEAMALPVSECRVLTHPPEELTRRRLARLGEGIGKVVYASERWVVKRERHPSESMALIAVWRALRRFDRVLPFGLGQRMLERPGRQIRLLRLLFQSVVVVAPRGFWLSTHVGRMWRVHYTREAHGEKLAGEYLTGTALVPERVTFPPTRVKVGRWPGWIVVSEATERVEATLHDRINELARSLRFDEIEVWLERLLAARQEGWKRGVFSLDAHLKNFGVTADRVVLLDTGGLTDKWEDVERRLRSEDPYLSPHERLGLEYTLRDRPDIVDRFNAKWRAVVNLDAVRSRWPRLC